MYVCIYVLYCIAYVVYILCMGCVYICVMCVCACMFICACGCMFTYMYCISCEYMYVYMHRLTYSHLWGLLHKFIRIGIQMHVNVFVFSFFIKNKNYFFLVSEWTNSEQRARKPHPTPSTCCTRFPLHLVLGQKIRVSAENPNFCHKPNLDSSTFFWARVLNSLSCSILILHPVLTETLRPQLTLSLKP